MKRQLTIVIKLGTSSIVNETDHEPLLSNLSIIVETACALQRDGHKVIIVSSGAIGVGLGYMNLPQRPKHLPQIQALAAIGQCKLIHLWDQLFMHRRQPIAQLLLTKIDIADRTQYQNAQNTFVELLRMNVIPIVNENDTLTVSEIKFGDNDTLSAITAGMVSAHYLFLMTDVDCLYDKNPRSHPDAKPIEVVDDIAHIVADTSTAGSAVGTGGMSTKIVAARLATSAGVTTIITNAFKPGNITSILQHSEAQRPQTRNSSPARQLTERPRTTSGSSTASTDATSIRKTLASVPLHTRFQPVRHPIRDRHFWLLHGIPPRGTIYIDQGAHSALTQRAGLLPVGVIDCDGTFTQAECVRLVVRSRPAKVSTATTSPDDADDDDKSTKTTLAHHAPKPDFEAGRALVNYSATEIRRIMGLRSVDIATVLGYADGEYVAFRENIAFF